jgi:peroxiredoxin
LNAPASTLALLAVSIGSSALASEPPKSIMKPYQATPTDRLGTLAPGTGVPVGEKVPDMQAVSLDGATVRLSSFYAKGPILLVFYRGGWCPYCNTEIHALSAAFPQFQKRGVTPVALSVDTPDAESKMKATYSIPFPVLSDSSAAVLQAFHLVNHVDGAMAEKLKGFGVDLERYSGQTHHIIAIPALFLVDRSGVVRWAHSDPEYTVRPTIEQILAVVDAKTLTAGKGP